MHPCPFGAAASGQLHMKCVPITELNVMGVSTAVIAENHSFACMTCTSIRPSIDMTPRLIRQINLKELAHWKMLPVACRIHIRHAVTILCH